jgi:hypothetical protein
VPVFVAPTKGVPAPIKVTSRMDKDALILQVTNPGTVHILPPTVTVKGYSATNELLFEHDTHGWYVLAGATRTDRLRLPKGRCADLRRLAVEVVSGQQTETLTVPVTSDACPQ